MKLLNWSRDRIIGCTLLTVKKKKKFKKVGTRYRIRYHNMYSITLPIGWVYFTFYYVCIFNFSVGYRAISTENFSFQSATTPGTVDNSRVGESEWNRLPFLCDYFPDNRGKPKEKREYIQRDAGFFFFFLKNRFCFICNSERYNRKDTVFSLNLLYRNMNVFQTWYDFQNILAL